MLDKAFWLANDKKGAVHIDLPKCVLTSKLKSNYKEFKHQNHIEKKTSYDFKKVTTLINESQNPVFYIGKGVLDASEELRKLVIKSNIPITTTMHAMGVFDENHHLSLQMLGMHGSYAANNAIQNSDCIICIGARFDDRTTGNLDYYAPKSKTSF